MGKSKKKSSQRLKEGTRQAFGQLIRPATEEESGLQGETSNLREEQNPRKISAPDLLQPANNKGQRNLTAGHPKRVTPAKVQTAGKQNRMEQMGTSSSESEQSALEEEEMEHYSSDSSYDFEGQTLGDLKHQLQWEKQRAKGKGQQTARWADYVEENARSRTFQQQEATLSGNENGQPSASLAEKLKQNRYNCGVKLSYVPPTNTKWVVLGQEDVYDLEKEWGFGLVGFFDGRFPGKQELIKLCNSWDVQYSITFHPKGWLIFKLNSEEDRMKVLSEGPYQAFGRQLILKNMTQDCNFSVESFKVLPVWINLPHLPIPCYKPAALERIASLVGNPLTTDMVTAAPFDFWPEYARVLVDVDITQELIRTIVLKLPWGIHTQKVLYETELKLCCKCKSSGHRETECNFGARSKGKTAVNQKNKTSDQIGMAANQKGQMIEAMQSNGLDVSINAAALNQKRVQEQQQHIQARQQSTCQKTDQKGHQEKGRTKQSVH